MATTFGQAFIFAIEYCNKFGVKMSEQQMHDFCNLLIEFRDGAAQLQRAADGCKAESDYDALSDPENQRKLQA